MRYQRSLSVICGFSLIALQATGGPQPCYAETAPPVQKNLEHCYAKTSHNLSGETIETEGAIAANTKRRPRIGLALGGGGTRGAAHIGVLRVLEKEGIQVDCVAGTSIGAIVGGLYCAGVPLDDIERMITKKSLKKAYFTVPVWFRVMLVPVFVLPHVFGRGHYDGLYRGGKFANFLNKAVGEKDHNIENFKIPFRAVAASLLDREAHAIKSGDVGTALQASSAIPVLRRPVEIDNNLYLDGGIINNLPINEVREMGADIVIAVSLNIDDDGYSEKDLKQFKRLGSVGNRVVNVLLCHVDKDQLKNADVIIQPKVNEIRFLSLKEKDALDAIKAGQVAATLAIAEIKRRIQSHTPVEVGSQSSGFAKTTPVSQ